MSVAFHDEESTDPEDSTPDQTITEGDKTCQESVVGIGFAIAPE